MCLTLTLNLTLIGGVIEELKTENDRLMVETKEALDREKDLQKEFESGTLISNEELDALKKKNKELEELIEAERAGHVGKLEAVTAEHLSKIKAEQETHVGKLEAVTAKHIETLEEHVQGHKKAEDDMKEKILRLEAELEALKKEQKDCNECERDLDLSKREVEKLQEQLTALQEREGRELEELKSKDEDLKRLRGDSWKHIKELAEEVLQENSELHKRGEACNFDIHASNAQWDEWNPKLRDAVSQSPRKDERLDLETRARVDTLTEESKKENQRLRISVRQHEIQNATKRAVQDIEADLARILEAPNPNPNPNPNYRRT